MFFPVTRAHLIGIYDDAGQRWFFSFVDVAAADERLDIHTMRRHHVDDGLIHTSPTFATWVTHWDPIARSDDDRSSLKLAMVSSGKFFPPGQRLVFRAPSISLDKGGEGHSTNHADQQPLRIIHRSTR
jgi:hypothetical protein